MRKSFLPKNPGLLLFPFHGLHTTVPPRSITCSLKSLFK